jgi:Cellulose binding domain
VRIWRRNLRSLGLALLLTAGTALAAVVAQQGSAPADTGAACGATYTIGWQTPSNSPPDFGATVTVTNNASFTIQTWTVSWSFTAGQTIVAGSPYSANVTQSATTVTATPAGSYDAVLTPGESTTFGFDGDYNGTSNPVPAVSCTGPSEGSGSSTLNGSLDPLGVNTASWDTNYTDPSIPSALSTAHVGLIRYPGGSYADGYLWQSNTYQGTTDPVDFAQYSSTTDSIAGGQKFVTVNYGSDTAADAGAWASAAASTSGEGVSLWEIGNEEYGSWEIDNHSDPHTATSYASNALAYMQAIKAVNSSNQVCYDYAMDPALAAGAGVTGYQTWNDTILGADAADINCADVHWYPVNGTPTESVQSIMSLVDNIPAAASEIDTALTSYDPSAYFVVGETGISNAANAWNEEPVGALYAAANAMEWLSFGAQSVDWWDVQNYGSETADFGMFSSGTSGEPAVDSPFPPYDGYQLASLMAVHGAKVGTLVIPTPNVYAYYSVLPNGSYDVMLVNGDPSNAYTVPASSLGLTSASETSYSYSAASPSIATSAVSGSSISVPAESIVVLTGGTGAPPTVTTSSPSPSPSPSSSPTTAAGAACSVAWSVTNSWSGGFQLGFTVTNSGSAALNGWTVDFTWPGAQTITQIWNAAATGTTITNLSYNGSLAVGGSTTFGLLGSGAVPASLGSVTCTPG